MKGVWILCEFVVHKNVPLFYIILINTSVAVDTVYGMLIHIQAIWGLSGDPKSYVANLKIIYEIGMVQSHGPSN